MTDIARATVHAPDLLILDEPTVGLDPEHRERMWALLDAERRDRGTTILFSTHYLTEAESCDRVILLAQGQVVAADTTGGAHGRDRERGRGNRRSRRGATRRARCRPWPPCP